VHFTKFCKLGLRPSVQMCTSPFSQFYTSLCALRRTVRPLIDTVTRPSDSDTDIVRRDSLCWEVKLTYLESWMGRDRPVFRDAGLRQWERTRSRRSTACIDEPRHLHWAAAAAAPTCTATTLYSRTSTCHSHTRWLQRLINLRAMTGQSDIRHNRNKTCNLAIYHVYIQ